VSVNIQLRRGTAAQWTAADPTLAEGELGLELDTGKFKQGDGSTAWSGLSYWGGGAGIAATLLDAKGDLIVGSAADTAARQAVGGNDTVLIADSAQANGLKWATVPTAGITARAVTAAKLFAASATARILARITAGSGDWEEATIAQIMGLNPAVDVQIFTANGTWNKPSGGRYTEVEVVGGGGGGGAAQATGSGERSVGGGGGGGGYARKLFATSALGATEAIVVGGGGNGGAAGLNNGATGGTSSFGTAGTLVQATGGTGGTAQVAAGTQGSSEGGAGGVGSGGSINAKGSAGGYGQRTTSGGLTGTGWGGAAAAYSGANEGNVFNAAGTPGYAYGGGGSGAHIGVSQTAKAGGNGAAGLVIVRTYP
jgi:hypothetical protein